MTLTYMPNEGRGSAYSTSLELKDGKATTDVAVSYTHLDVYKRQDVWGGESDIAEKFAGGTGTESDPYQISNGAQLAYLAQQVNAGTNYSWHTLVVQFI